MPARSMGCPGCENLSMDCCDIRRSFGLLRLWNAKALASRRCSVSLAVPEAGSERLTREAWLALEPSG